jgi:hypothetical protein
MKREESDSQSEIDEDEEKEHHPVDYNRKDKYSGTEDLSMIIGQNQNQNLTINETIQDLILDHSKEKSFNQIDGKNLQ